MAKVKGFNPPVTKLEYEEKDGSLHYFGEFMRMIFGEGFISPVDPTKDIIGKSRRGARPTERGELSARRKFVRKAFKGCINLWALMPENCPFFEEDPPLPAKETIWQAKLDHGVVCSYFDLWMRCCMKHAMAHDGVMPVSECFPCVAECIQDPAMAWDDAASDETVERNGSAAIVIIGNNAPFSWSVSGTGFSLEHAETDGLGNVLHADETACGPATITVTGCDEREAVGYVRCTTGGWVSIYSCGNPQPFGCMVIKGKDKVRTYCNMTLSPTCVGMPDPPCDLLCPTSNCVSDDPCHKAGDYWWYVHYSQKWEWKC